VFQFLTQLLDPISPAVITAKVALFQPPNLAPHPNVELLSVEPDDFRADLLEAIRLDAPLSSGDCRMPSQTRALLRNVKKGRTLTIAHKFPS
jgi:hypothetical protein